MGGEVSVVTGQIWVCCLASYAKYKDTNTLKIHLIFPSNSCVKGGEVLPKKPKSLFYLKLNHERSKQTKKESLEFLGPCD